jgi:hypothetical protein
MEYNDESLLKIYVPIRGPLLQIFEDPDEFFKIAREKYDLEDVEI